MARLLERVVKDRFEDDFGQVIQNIHSEDVCDGQYCVIHNPSDHHMRDWPLLWRESMENDSFRGRLGHGMFERICPHGVGHPDPDSERYNREVLREDTAGIHGCDGCCRSPEQDQDQAA